MRFGYEYELITGSTGICLFTAPSLEEAEAYVNKVTSDPGYLRVYNLNELPTVTTIGDFRRLFPGMKPLDKPIDV
jgi:hypothetical protein